MWSFSRYAPCDHVTEAVQQQGVVCGLGRLWTTHRHESTVMTQLISAEFTQFCEEPDQRLQAQSRRSFFKQTVIRQHSLYVVHTGKIGSIETSKSLDWIVQCLTSPPTQYRLYGRRFLQVKRPNQQYQSTEVSYKREIKQRKQHKHTCRGNNAHTKRYTHKAQQVP